MHLSLSTEPPKTTPKLSYDVLIENQQDGSVIATVLNLPDCKAVGATKEKALTNLSQLLKARLAKAEVVSLEIEPPKTENPWMKMAGKYKDDPQFDEMLAYIEAERRELDAEMDAYYRQLDAQDEQN